MNAGFIALACILGIIVCGFVGWMFWRWRESVDAESKAFASVSEWTNIDDASEIVWKIDLLRGVQRELKSAFARSDLDGGAKAALSHPLYIQVQEELDELHDRLMTLV